jgi:hypothetical protein
MKNTTTGTTYTVLKPEKKVPPTIYFTTKALKWIEAIIDEHDTEVGFYGIVEEDKAAYSFLVKDIFYPKHQLANHSTCEISREGETDVMNWLVDHDRSADCGMMMVWGHSHHTMGVFASGQDDKQALDRMNDTRYHIIRVIVNKEKLMSVSFFDFNQQLKFENVQWHEHTVDNEKIQKQVIDEIKKVINDDAIPVSKKILDIDRIMYQDLEMEEIIKKVKELKEINIPKASVSTSTGFTYGNGRPYIAYGNPDRFPLLNGTKTGPEEHQINMFSSKELMEQESMYPYRSGDMLQEDADELMRHFENIS